LLFHVQATRSYVGQVRRTISNPDFASLFDLGNSSVLAILIDTSSSMGNEIEAVKSQVYEIIDVRNIFLFRK
jgi:Mg-chelatase subunit ChlD